MFAVIANASIKTSGAFCSTKRPMKPTTLQSSARHNSRRTTPIGGNGDRLDPVGDQDHPGSAEADPDPMPLLFRGDGDDPIGRLAERPFDRLVEKPFEGGEARVHRDQGMGCIEHPHVRAERRQPAQRPPFEL